MREIKFRAWDYNNECIIPWEKVMIEKDEDENKMSVVVFDGAIGDHYDDFPIMQYVGLKDKNGIDIYEGDIVKVRNGATTFESYFIGDVVFEKGEFGHRAVKFEGSRPPYMFNSDVVLSIRNSNLTEIIGNIFENEDLISNT